MGLFEKREEELQIESPPIKDVYVAGNDNHPYLRIEVGQRFRVKNQEYDIIIEEIVFREDRYRKFGDIVFGIYGNVNGIISLWKEEVIPPKHRISVKYDLEGF